MNMDDKYGRPIYQEPDELDPWKESDEYNNLIHMSNSKLFRALKAIQDKDPDGGPFEPTEQMYEEHRKWAIRTYGYEVWSTYVTDIRY